MRLLDLTWLQAHPASAQSNKPWREEGSTALHCASHMRPLDSQAHLSPSLVLVQASSKIVSSLPCDTHCQHSAVVTLPILAHPGPPAIRSRGHSPVTVPTRPRRRIISTTIQAPV